jgi:signal transduction histidine kinase
MSRELSVLIVEDSENDAALLVRQLERNGEYEIYHERVETAEGMRKALRQRSWDVVLSDYKMPQFSAPLALNLLKESELDIPFIVVSGSIGEDVAVAAMKAGSHDYVMKDNLARLLPAIERELREAQMRALHREAEKQLRVTERLRAVGEMAASIVHDLKTPLQAVLTVTEILSQHDLPGEIRASHCRTINEQVLRMVTLTQQVLEFAKGEIRISASMIDLIRFCEDIVNSFNATLSGTSITVNFSHLLNGGVSPSVILDSEKIWRVLTNLMNNARDAMPYGGEINVRLMMNREIIRLEVADNGQGIPEMVRSRIFEPFVSEGKTKGTGLGLAIVQQIVKAHGGTVTVETAEGKGTTFFVILPRVALKSANHAPVDVVHALQG